MKVWAVPTQLSQEVASEVSGLLGNASRKLGACTLVPKTSQGLF